MSARAARIVSCALLAPFLLALVYGYASGGALQLITGGDIRSASPRAVPDALLAPGDASTVVRLAAIGGAVAVFAVVFAVGRAAAKARRPALHGDAALGGVKEARRASLLGNEGPVLGKLRGRFVRLPRSLSAMVLAAPEQKKTTTVVIPTCYLHSGSLFVTDVKPELFETASEYRRRNGQRVFRFAPFDAEGRTHRYNPFDDMPPTVADRIDRIMYVAALWYPREGAPIWYETARQVFLGLALYLDESEGVTASFPEIYRHGTGLGMGLRAYVRQIIKERGSGGDVTGPVLPGPALSETCRMSLDALATIESAPMASSIERTFLAPLAMFANPRLAAATRESDFRMSDYTAQGKPPQSVFFAMSGDDIERAAPFVSLMFTQLLYVFARRPAGQSLAPHERCVALLDEGGQLGYIDAVRRTPAVARGHGLSLVFVAQSIGQISDQRPNGYGHEGARALADSMPTRLSFTPSSLAEAEELSRTVGTTTTHSVSRRRAGLGRQHALGERSESEAARAVLMTQEAQRLSPDKALLRTVLGDVLLIERVPFYRDAEIVRRMCSVSPTLASACTVPGTRLLWRWPTERQVFAARADLSAPVPQIVVGDAPPIPVVAPIAMPESLDEMDGAAEVDMAAVMTQTEHLAPLGDEATDDEIAAMGAALWAAIDDTGD